MFYFFLILSLTPNSNANERIKHIQVKNDEIIKVHTSLGVATIIEVSDRPNSVVLGNQSHFKVEYLDQAITIKPLSSHSKSNLYIYTDYNRFNVELLTGSENLANYVIYLTPKKEDLKKSIQNSIKNKTKLIHKTMKNGELIFKLSKIGFLDDSKYFLEFTINSLKNIKMKPEWIWVTQNRATRPIYELHLSSTDFKNKNVIHGSIILQKNEIKINDPLKIELRRKITSSILLPKLEF